jgi:hypothetical protein
MLLPVGAEESALTVFRKKCFDDFPFSEQIENGRNAMQP